MRTGPLNQPAEVIEPAKELIAMSATLSSPHTYLSLALADLKRADEAVQVWSDALKTLRGRARQEIAVGIGYLTLGNELTESHIQTLVTVLTTVANDVENPDPRAQALALTLRAERLEKDPATQKALLAEAVPWKALAAQQEQLSAEALKAEVADLLRRAGYLVRQRGPDRDWRRPLDTRRLIVLRRCRSAPPPCRTQCPRNACPVVASGHDARASPTASPAVSSCHAAVHAARIGRAITRTRFGASSCRPGVAAWSTRSRGAMSASWPASALHGHGAPGFSPGALERAIPTPHTSAWNPQRGSAMDVVERREDGPDGITIARCRELLGTDAQALTDREVALIRQHAETMAHIFIDQFLSERRTWG